jgi:signal transduction histidine kinase
VQPQKARAADDVRLLERCINDLIVVLALPAIWAGRDSSQIVDTLLDVLVRMLRLDIAYVRLRESVQGTVVEQVRSAERPDVAPDVFGRAFGRWLTGEISVPRLVLPNPAGDGVVSVAVFRLGVQDELGRFIAASRRPDFPTNTEQLLMQVAMNQAAIGLQEARHLREQRLAREELERGVVERTAELAALNQKLQNEILERVRTEELNGALAGRLIKSQEAERVRIARDLHDGVCQELACIVSDIDQLRTQDGQISADTQEILDSLQQRIAGVSQSLRLLSHELHPAVLKFMGLRTALQSHCADFARQHIVRVKFYADHEVEPVSPPVALALFRIAQEALQNIARHGHARNATVSLARDTTHVTLTIADDGEGFDVEAARPNPGLGLLSMEERARMVQGNVVIHSEPGEGTTIEVRVPVAFEPSDT